MAHVHCPKHGSQGAAAVCTHVAECLRAGQPVSMPLAPVRATYAGTTLGPTWLCGACAAQFQVPPQGETWDGDAGLERYRSEIDWSPVCLQCLQDSRSGNSMHDLEFRRATVDDAALLARMNQQLIRDEGHRNPMSLAELQARMAGWLAGEYEAFLFLQAGTAAGYVLFRREPQWIYVRQLFVVPEQRRRGIARSALAWLRANVWQGAPRLRMEVLVQNTAAIAFWHSAGFQDYALTMELDQNSG